MSRSKAAAALEPFDGYPVTAVGIEVPSAGGGLNDALKIDPVEFHHGDTVVIVLEMTVGKVRFDEIVKDDPDSGLRRVHVGKGVNATIIDRSIVATVLDAQKAKIEAAKDRESGAQRIPGAKPDLDEFDDGLGDEYDEDADPPTLGDGDAPNLSAVPDPVDDDAADGS